MALPDIAQEQSGSLREIRDLLVTNNEMMKTFQRGQSEHMSFIREQAKDDKKQRREDQQREDDEAHKEALERSKSLMDNPLIELTKTISSTLMDSHIVLVDIYECLKFMKDDLAKAAECACNGSGDDRWFYGWRFQTR